jgi:hypothetical protein
LNHHQSLCQWVTCGPSWGHILLKTFLLPLLSPRVLPYVSPISPARNGLAMYPVVHCPLALDLATPLLFLNYCLPSTSFSSWHQTSPKPRATGQP